jgi:hypothetical protein
MWAYLFLLVPFVLYFHQYIGVLGRRIYHYFKHVNFHGCHVQLYDGVRQGSIHLPFVNGHYHVTTYYIYTQNYETPIVEADIDITRHHKELIHHLTYYSYGKTYYMPVTGHILGKPGLTVVLKKHGDERHCVFHLRENDCINLLVMVRELEFELNKDVTLAQTYD